MMKQLLALILALSFMSISWSQDVEESSETEVEAADVTAAADDDESVDEDDAELDEPGYGIEEEEDDFIPSQEVSADQSLPFPVDI